MEKNINESGRSMLEVISVIAIMIVLVIAGLTGYDYLIQYRKRQETAKIATSAIMSVRSADLARKIGAKGVIKPAVINPTAKRDGAPESDFFVLPDSEGSFAVVRSMKDGAFAMALKIEPGTCSTVFDSLAASSAVAFAPQDAGFSADSSTAQWKRDTEKALDELNVDEKTKDEKSDHIGVDLSYRDKLAKYNYSKTDENGNFEEQTIGGTRISAKVAEKWQEIQNECAATGRLMIASGCSGGSSPQYYPTNSGCSSCNIDEVWTKENPCCPKAKVCDNHCGCPSGTKLMTVNDTCKCVICDPTAADKDNETCTDKYDLFTKHVCYELGGTPDCIECRVDGDCAIPQPERPYQSYGDKGAYSVFNSLFDNEKIDQLFCIDKSICRECNKNYDPKQYENKTKAASDNNGNAYCPEERPLCQKTGACDKCPGDGVYNPITKECDCPAGTIAVVGDDGKRMCVACIDNYANNAKDTGCSNEKPFCYPEGANAENDVRYGQGKTNKFTATLNCKACTLDEHCTGNGMYCDSYDSEGKYSGKATRDYKHEYVCKKEVPPCKDDHGEGLQDTGCGTEGNKGLNLCMPEDNPEGNGTNMEGYECYECYLDKADQSWGCSDDDVCKITTEKPGRYGVCKECKVTAGDKASPSNTDDGCDGTSPVCKASEDDYGDSCQVCRDTAKDANRDAGCPDAKKPLCNDPNTKEGTKNYGSACYLCQKVEVSKDKDLGCDNDNNHLCETKEPNGFANTCRRCQDTQKKDRQDRGCTDPEYPMCAVSTEGEFGDECHKCINDIPDDEQTADNKKFDTGCSEETPYCLAAEGQFGDACFENKECDGVYFNAQGTEMTETECAAIGGCALKNSDHCHESSLTIEGHENACICCPTDMVWNAQKNECAYCIDSATAANQDAGCPEDKPICNTGTNDGKNTSNLQNTGDKKCYKCIDDKKNNRDSGCPEETPICGIQTSANHYVSDQASNQLSNTCLYCLDNKTETTTDLGCVSDNKEHICVPDDDGGTPQSNGAANPFRNHASGLAGTQCLECLLHSNCTKQYDNASYYCDNYKVTDKPSWTCKKCPDGSVWSDAIKACCDGCVDKDTNKCIKMSDYEDLEKDSNGYCKCKVLNRKFDFPFKRVENIPSDYSQSFNYQYERQNSSFLQLKTTARGSLKKMYCAHEAQFNVLADDCVYATFLGSGNCTACLQNCLNNKNDCLDHKSKYMCNYTKTVSIPAGSGPYNSIWVSISDIHKTACGLKGKEGWSWVTIK